MLEMYKGVANSPETTITNDINNLDTIIYILDETRIPELPNLMVLGNGISAETVKVLSIAGNALTVERGFQGVPKSWNAGTIIARNFTEYDYNSLVENVKELDSESQDTKGDVGDLEDLTTDDNANLVSAINEVKSQSNDIATKELPNKANKIQEGWKVLDSANFRNGWTGTVKYRKNEFGKTELIGTISGGVRSNTTQLFELPLGYRPSSVLRMIACGYSTTNDFVILGLDGTGNVYLAFKDIVSNIVSFDGIAFY